MGLLLAVLWMGVKLAYRWLPDGFLAQIRENRADSGFLLPQIMLAGLIVLSAVTIVYFIYSLTGSRTSGILLLFLISVVMVYLSGGLAPSMFMPERMQAVGRWLPTTYLMEAVGNLLTGRNKTGTSQCAAILVLSTVMCGMMAYVLRRREE